MEGSCSGTDQGSTWHLSRVARFSWTGPQGHKYPTSSLKNPDSHQIQQNSTHCTSSKEVSLISLYTNTIDLNSEDSLLAKEENVHCQIEFA